MQQQQEISAVGSKEVLAAASTTTTTTTTKQQHTMALDVRYSFMILWARKLSSINDTRKWEVACCAAPVFEEGVLSPSETLVRLLCHCVHIKLISAVSSKFADMTKLISVQFNSAISCNPPLCPGLGPGSSGKFEVVWYYPLSSLISQPSYDDNNG